ncbi:hypothetical protein KGQ20_32295 [Catenulispora sp. NF23]|uniref:hypothetical protein n=1 Tax=Catenulispora pinistramenti TaxID=2705254 RepID=UPI001BABE2C2|nr:hypothetical protein [Catenulispora pinistramenti]MBS2537445.1 hypothetical protein [Catenulispora pinistramenti]
MADGPDDIAIDYARGTLMSARGEVTERTVNASRVMARAFPDSYTTGLVTQLLKHSGFFRDHAELRLPLIEEAVVAARQIKDTEPTWPGLVIEAIVTQARCLQTLGRSADAMRVFAELEQYRGLRSRLERFPPHKNHWDAWPTALAESSRHAEAVELWYEALEYERALSYSAGLPWIVLELTDALEVLGRFDEAVAVFSAHLVSKQSKYGPDLCSLVHLARIHQAAGNPAARAATLDEACAVLSTLPRHDESGRPVRFMAALNHFLVCSTRADEPPRTDGEPGYSYGSYWWSPGLRPRFHAEAETLLAEASALPHGPDRVIRHRRATVRLASEFLRHRPERLAEPFDEGVGLAEEALCGGSEAAPELLARALLDRAQYRATRQDFGGAATDFTAALDLIKH